MRKYFHSQPGYNVCALPAGTGAGHSCEHSPPAELNTSANRLAIVAYWHSCTCNTNTSNSRQSGNSKDGFTVAEEDERWHRKRIHTHLQSLPSRDKQLYHKHSTPSICSHSNRNSDQQEQVVHRRGPIAQQLHRRDRLEKLVTPPTPRCCCCAFDTCTTFAHISLYSADTVSTWNLGLDYN